MTAFYATTADLFRNLVAAWWPWLLLVAIVVGLPSLLVAGLKWLDRELDDMGRAFDDGFSSIDLDDLLDGDEWLARHLAAEEAAWARLVAAADFETTRLEIAALPETRTR